MSSSRKGQDNKNSPYSGRWVAKMDGRIVGQGGTPELAKQAAKAARHKENAEIEFVPPKNTSQIPAHVYLVQSLIPKSLKVFLVGGAVRDILLKRPSFDFDFVVAGDALKLGKDIANSINGDYYILDKARAAARVLFLSEEGQQISLDFVAQNGKTIEDDLGARDFTINSMALDLMRPDALLDPLEGARDLQSKSLRASHSQSIKNDPIRILRAIRLAAQFDLRIEKDTLAELKRWAATLAESSAERVRDEFFRVLDIANISKSLRALKIIGALQIILPELSELEALEQSPPHLFNVWEHSLRTIESLEKVLAQLDSHYPLEGAGDLFSGLIVLQLGRYRKQISERMQSEFVARRSLRSLLLFTALFHDVGKTESQSKDKDRIRYQGHEAAGAEIVKRRMEKLHFSKAEIDYVYTISKGHKRPAEISRTASHPDRRTIYRYFRDYGKAGLEICLISIADLMGRHGVELRDDLLTKRLAIVRPLLEAYWEKNEELVSPPALVNGDDLKDQLGMQDGPKIGEILESIREAQAVGEIETKSGALKMAKRLLVN